ncbi:hypothetical protein R1sor_005887 [Riccia sorocarpa]|uniref:Uncharacterized protein n=1 Tax=Riccia sorocarpa TaxID=122646 RepID=A0ABD3HMW9_9MARC
MTISSETRQEEENKRLKKQLSLPKLRQPDSLGDYGSDFTSDYKGHKSIFSRAVAQIQLEWGVDQEEDVFIGLEKAAELLVHIGDAPCHF